MTIAVQETQGKLGLPFVDDSYIMKSQCCHFSTFLHDFLDILKRMLQSIYIVNLE